MNETVEDVEITRGMKILDDIKNLNNELVDLAGESVPNKCAIDAKLDEIQRLKDKFMQESNKWLMEKMEGITNE